MGRASIKENKNVYQLNRQWEGTATSGRSLNKMNKKQERLIKITADDIIDNDALDDFIYIQEELEKISVNVETLQLWSERMLASGAIDEDAYNKRKSQKSHN